MRRQIPNEVRSDVLAMIVSYPTSTSGIITVLLKMPPKHTKVKEKNKEKAPTNYAYTLRDLQSMVQLLLLKTRSLDNRAIPEFSFA